MARTRCSRARFVGVNSTPDMSIRFASSIDSEALSVLVLEASQSVRDSDFTKEGWDLLKSTNTPQAFEKRFETKNYFCLVFEVDREIVGYLAMIDFEKIDHMFVLPKHRNNGVCKKLWSKAKEFCVESGYGMYYWVRSSSYAEPVYRSFGFRPKGERKSSNGISFQFMELGKNES